jgi:citrate lyase subunit beta / citryl-CoA lyase
MASLRPRRSVLYIPGSNFRGLDKGRELPADVLILDLEDSVLPDGKAEARAAIAAAIGVRAYGKREVVVRVNGLDTPWIASDIAAVVASRPNAILIPKVSQPEDIRRARNALLAAKAPRDLKLWAMIETPLGILNAQAIAATAADSGANIECLVIGTNDLSTETGLRIQPGRALMLPWLTQILAAGRAYDLAVIDGTHIDLDDMDGFYVECQQGRDLGMDGKSLIHPKQVSLANEIYSPSVADIAWAQSVVDAFETPDNANKGVILVDGRMLERLHERMAQNILDKAKQIEMIDVGGRKSG